jgi:hypothetical protein
MPWRRARDSEVKHTLGLRLLQQVDIKNFFMTKDYKLVYEEQLPGEREDNISFVARIICKLFYINTYKHTRKPVLHSRKSGKCNLEICNQIFLLAYMYANPVPNH